MSINDKIKQVLTLKNLSPSHFADDIGVQRSSISHILSGRNRPSLDLIQKIVRRFPEFTYDWFLEGNLTIQDSSTVNKEIEKNSRLFTPVNLSSPTPSLPDSATPTATTLTTTTSEALRSTDDNKPISPESTLAIPSPTVERVLIFYSDGTFQDYKPG